MIAVTSPLRRAEFLKNMSEYQRSPAPGPGLPPETGAAALPLRADPVIADPEVPEKARRRHFSAAYKLRVLKEADALDQPGQLGELLRREGLYSSHLAFWRRQRDAGSLQSLRPHRRGRRPRLTNSLAKRVTYLERENHGLRARLRQAELVIDVQRKSLIDSGGDARCRRRRRDGLVTAVRHLAPEVGVQAACKALLVPRVLFSRARRATSDVPLPVAKTPASATRHPRALDEQERAQVLALLYTDRFVDCPPEVVYAMLLDEGAYLCSPRTMYRILDDHQEVRERCGQLQRPVYGRSELLATAPNQVWLWDITKLLGPATWIYLYFYVILDIFSRYVVGWMLADGERAALATRLIDETCAKQTVEPAQLTIHADRGASMASKPVAFLLADLGVTKTHSWPHTSNDNPFSESHLKTLKYRPDFPDRFTSKEYAHDFCRAFFSWYNLDHRHFGIAFLTPHVVHHGLAEEVLAARHATVKVAYHAQPERFPRGAPVPAALPAEVLINPPIIPAPVGTLLPEVH